MMRGCVWLTNRSPHAVQLPAGRADPQSWSPRISWSVRCIASAMALGIAEIILLPLRVGGEHTSLGHQPGIGGPVPKFATEMMRGRRKPPYRSGTAGTLAKRASTWPRDHFCRSTMAPRASLAHDRGNEFLANIDADHGDRGIGCLRHGVLLVFGAPCQLALAGGGREHGRGPSH